MEFYDAYKTFEELDEKTLTERFDKSDFSTKLFLLLFFSMHALAGYYEEFEQ